MENEDIGYLRKSYDKSKLSLADVNFQPMDFFKLRFDDALNNKNIEEYKNPFKSYSPYTHDITNGIIIVKPKMVRRAILKRGLSLMLRKVSLAFL